MPTTPFPRTARCSGAHAATAVLLSCACAFSGFGLPTQVAYADDGQPARNQAASDIASISTPDDARTDGLLVFARPDGAIETLGRNDGAADALSRELDAAGLSEKSRFEASDGTIGATVQPAEGQSLDEAIRAAAAVEGVAAVQPNYVYDLIDASPEPADSNAFAANGEEAVSPLARIVVDDPFAHISDPFERNNQYWLYTARFNEAWNKTATEGNVVIAVLDTGVMADHRDLGGNVLTRYAWDSYENAPLYESGRKPFNGTHGTLVAGAAAAVANNGFGMAGASLNASVLPVKVCDDSAKPKITSASLIAAYEYLFDLIDTNGVGIRVVNMSLGSYSESMRDSGLEECIERARNDYGIVTVCAGGNGNQVDAPNTGRLYPADFEACVSVTALEADGTNVVWSDYNEYKDIGAPGKAVTAPLASASGDTEAFTSASGSSLAAPIVSSAFALMFAAKPDARVDETIEALYASARPIVDPEHDRTQTSGSHGALDAAGALNHLEAHHSPFADVTASDWFFEATNYASEHGIMNGHDGAFEPEESLTRAQAAQVLYNYLGNGAIAQPAQLSDVDQGQWYAKAVNWAVEADVMEGLSGTGTFGVDEALSREQLALVMARIAHADTASANRDAFDALPDRGETSPWAVDAVIWATDAGVINGKVTPSATLLAPKESITRAQMAQVMMNSLENGLI